MKGEHMKVHTKTERHVKVEIGRGDLVEYLRARGYEPNKTLEISVRGTGQSFEPVTIHIGDGGRLEPIVAEWTEEVVVAEWTEEVEEE